MKQSEGTILRLVLIFGLGLLSSTFFVKMMMTMTNKEEDVAHPGKVDDDQGGGDDDDGEGEEEAKGEEEDVVPDVLRTPPVRSTAGRGILRRRRDNFYSGMMTEMDWT